MSMRYLLHQNGFAFLLSLVFQTGQGKIFYRGVNEEASQVEISEGLSQAGVADVMEVLAATPSVMIPHALSVLQVDADHSSHLTSQDESMEAWFIDEYGNLHIPGAYPRQITVCIHEMKSNDFPHGIPLGGL
jgi:hypothetical protein